MSCANASPLAAMYRCTALALRTTVTKALCFSKPLALAVILVGCGNGAGSPAEDAAPSPDAPAADAASINCEAASLALTTALDTVVTDTDFTLLLRDSQQRNFAHSIGTSTPETLYESASTSKWVTAITILRLVDAGVLSLSDRPQDYLPFWTSDAANPLSRITLAQLLSFTSGLEETALCTNLGAANFGNCVETIYEANLATPVEPGTAFYYESSHMQVAGLMAVRAAELAGWTEVFSAFQSSTELFLTAQYDLPSLANPRLAGGMHWRASEYLEFLDAFFHDELLSAQLKTTVLADQTGSVAIRYSPALENIGEDWHYSFGFWLECQSSTFDCDGVGRISSPGAYGAYPFIDYELGYVGILGREGALGSYPEGKRVLDSVETELRDWVNCQR